MKKTAAASVLVRPVVKVGANYYNGDDVTDTTSWVTYSYTWTVNPATGLPWTISEVNALQFGVWTDAGHDSTWQECCVTGLEVKYTPTW